MTKKKPHDNSQESPFAKALGHVDGDGPTEDEPEEPGNGATVSQLPRERRRRAKVPRKAKRSRKASP
jgi:hypothetical protein